VISRRAAGLLFIVLMALGMSCAVSGVVTIVNTGLGGGYLARWMRAWAVAAMVATPTALLLAPPLRRFTDSLTR
jgi:hypothetical protein